MNDVDASSSDMTPHVVHWPDKNCFEAVVQGQRCVLTYRRDSGPSEGVLDLNHTHVPRALEGRGIAAALVAAALEWAEREGLKVWPSCSYVRVYMRRHPQTQHLLKTP